MVDAVAAAVEDADVDADGFEEGFGEGVGAVVEGGLVEGEVAFHCVRAEAVGEHDVVDGVVGAFDASIEVGELAGGFVEGDGVYPGHGCGWGDTPILTFPPAPGSRGKG